MTVAEARANLFRIAQDVRVPELKAEGRWKSASEQIELLQDHMVSCSLARAVLEEGWLFVTEGVKSLEDRWDGIEGWQMAVTQNKPAQKAIVEAKRKLEPDVYRGIRDGKWLADKLRVQIKRLERDEEACSRIYSMLSGG